MVQISRAALLLCALALPFPAAAQQGPDHAALRDRSLVVLERQFGAFRDATGVLAGTSAAFCAGTGDGADLNAAFAATWRAWAPLDSYQFGPVEQTGAALSVNFWPDKKNFVGRALDGLLEQPEAAQAAPATIAASSAAIQGLPAIELLLTTDRPTCPAIVGISGYLDQTAQALFEGWFAPGGWADLVRSAGPDNPVYRNDAEFTAVLFTAVDFGLDRVADARLARPLGTFEASYPTRAEAWRSGLTAEIAAAQLAGVAELMDDGFAEAVPAGKRESFDSQIGIAERRLRDIGMPISDAVADPGTRIRVEAAQSRVNNLREYLDLAIGPELGVELGFSAADGD
ncbi:imelysin family protein [Tropicimonas sp. IMCC34043]|uniref:imelysin family protein n=1 Tax=Tropicimonas sp. IMCC34043 TaxID=2248760 RepID=UPI001300AD37|nr:imelysin family protein [Tropicimonas sp. IMCC34043]